MAHRAHNESHAWRASLLLIDDDVLLGDSLARVLKPAGYDVHRAFDAAEALDKLEQGLRPDLILLDLMMPRMDGWEFRVAQRRDARWANIPIIVLSGDDSAKARAIDGDAFLPKPADARVLLDTIERLLTAAERRKLDERALELERLSSLGILAAGIAHEINNPLTAVVGNLELARGALQRLPCGVDEGAAAQLAYVEQLLVRAVEGAERITQVVRGVATFARPDAEQLMPVDVESILDATLQLVSNELRHRARLEKAYAPVPRVRANPAKLGQVFLNLIVNALHALRDEAGAPQVIRVSTSIGDDGQVVVSVSDTGRGIPPELVGRIFDPFFTTKPQGRGTGLGLAISRRLLETMGGHISVESKLLEGSTFRVTLPALGHAAREQPRAQPTELELPARRSHRPKVLVVDDELMICELLGRTLSDEYVVETLTDARKARSRLVSGEWFDVVLCDLMMPEISGMDLHEELSRARPDQAQRMLFMTGGSFTERASAFLRQPGIVPVEKPFRAPELLQRIARLTRATDGAREVSPSIPPS